jgi:hypothetical protein
VIHITGVGLFHHHHPFILAQLPVQDALADIDGVHPPGAILQQAVAKPAGRSAHVSAHLPFYLNGKDLQRCC